MPEGLLRHPRPFDPKRIPPTVRVSKGTRFRTSLIRLDTRDRIRSSALLRRKGQSGRHQLSGRRCLGSWQHRDAVNAFTASGFDLWKTARQPAGVGISNADQQPLPAKCVRFVATKGPSAPLNHKRRARCERSLGGVLVPNHAQFPALEALRQIRAHFFEGDDVQVTVCVEIGQLDQVIDETFRPADRA